MRREQIDIYLKALAIRDMLKIEIKSIIFVKNKYNGEKFSYFSCYWALAS